jgi:RNA polymerase sigma-70 factor (ECF subfamily)
MTDKADPELLRRMEDAARNLPKLQLQIFLAHRLDGMPYEEIARRTGLSVRRVERHMAKAIYKIFKQLDGEPLHWWERWF